MIGVTPDAGRTLVRFCILGISLFSLTARVIAKEHTSLGKLDKISDFLHQKFDGESVAKVEPLKAEVIVELHEYPGQSLLNDNHEVKGTMNELHTLAQDPGKRRSSKLMHELQTKMTARLEPVLKVLNEEQVPFETLWAFVEVYINRASWRVIQRIAEVEEVRRVRSPGTFSIRPPKVPPSLKPRPKPTGNITWPLAMSNARCSEITCLGEGVTVGFIDGGARVTHQEIRGNWIGMPYGFYDGAHPQVNRDNEGHGTHVVGIGVWANVGVAPKAKWMMCLGCTADNCSEASVKICGQYLTCPLACGDDSINKVTKDCSKRPDIISNSWSMYPDELLPDTPDDFYYSILQLWNYLGIISTFSAGNAGPNCNNCNPPGTYDISLSVAAVDINTTLAWFSSVGPQLSKRPLTGHSTASGTCKKITVLLILPRRFYVP